MSNKQKERIKFIEESGFQDVDMPSGLVVAIVDREFGKTVNEFYWYKKEKGLDQSRGLKKPKGLFPNYKRPSIASSGWIRNYVHEFYQGLFTLFEMKLSDELIDYFNSLIKQFEEKKAKLWALVDAMAAGAEENRLQIYFYDLHIINLREIQKGNHKGQLDRHSFIREEPRMKEIPLAKGAKRIDPEEIIIKPIVTISYLKFRKGFESLIQQRRLEIEPADFESFIKSAFQYRPEFNVSPVNQTYVFKWSKPVYSFIILMSDLKKQDVINIPKKSLFHWIDFHVPTTDDTIDSYYSRKGKYKMEKLIDLELFT